MKTINKYCVDCGGRLALESRDGIELNCLCPSCGARWCLIWDDEENWIMGFQCDNGTHNRDVHDHGRCDY